jgi:hypothetical protein
VRHDVADDGEIGVAAVMNEQDFRIPITALQSTSMANRTLAALPASSLSWRPGVQGSAWFTCTGGVGDTRLGQRGELGRVALRQQRWRVL